MVINNMLYSIIIAISIWTIIPCPNLQWNKDTLKYLMCGFVITGFIIATLFLFILLFTLKCNFSLLLSSVICTVFPILITGGIHFDGFCDTVDAIASYQSIDKKLLILKDSHVGSSSVMWSICYFLVYTGLWNELLGYSKIDFTYNNIYNLYILLLAIFVLPRILSALSVISFPKAKNTGLVKTFSSNADNIYTIIFCIIIFIITMLLLCSISRLLFISFFIFAICSMLLYYVFSKWQFRGITGDIAGFFLQIYELSSLMLLVILYR